jgi:hypothetical protein
MTTQRAGILLVLGWMSGAGAQAERQSAWNWRAELAARGPQDEITIIATLTDRVDPPPVRSVPTAAGATPDWSRP